jgi:hypothetical protein
MTIYYQPDKTNIIMHLKSTDRWYMIADYDAAGRPHLFVNINGLEAPLLSGSDFRKAHPGYKNSQVLELYNAMIREVFQRMNAGAECIDLAEIEEVVMLDFQKNDENN